jgi:hypothetical protein
MNYRTPMTPEEHAAYLSMPKTAYGSVVSLFYVPLGQVAAYEAQWHDWLATHPKRLWPEWIKPWADAKR